MAEGTITRLATLKVLESLRPDATVTICIPLFLAGGEGDRAFARFYPTIAIDGCEKRCAARSTEMYSARPAASIVVNELCPAAAGRLGTAQQLNTAGMDAVNAVAAQGGSPAAAAAPNPQPDRIIAYYLHTTYRCATCRSIEAYSREAIDTGFARELKDGRLEFRLVNIQLSENRHFIQDYQLFTKSLVLVRMKDGKQVEWTNLDRVWELTGNRDAFVAYVQQGVRGYLEKK
jgi:hypothetical protein